MAAPRIQLNQKLQQKLALLLQPLPGDGETPDIVQGYQGMLVAEKILKDRGAVGFLIGGLAEKVWNRQRKELDLDYSKDVDVLVIPNNDQTPFELASPFEGGIDWWLPQSDQIKIRDTAGDSTWNETWYTNGNKITLRFGITAWGDEEPGLYVLNPDQVVDMRYAEAVASEEGGLEEELEEHFRSRVRKRMRTCLPKFIKDGPLRVADEYVGIDTFHFELVRAMRQMTKNGT